MYKLHGRTVITVQCKELSVTPQAAATALTGMHWMTGVEVQNDTLVVSYTSCTLERIKQNVYNRLGQFLK